MSTRELIRRFGRYARKRNIMDFKVKAYESKGSHRRVYLNGRSTTVPWTRNLTTGTLRRILKQLDIDDFLETEVVRSRKKGPR